MTTRGKGWPAIERGTRTLAIGAAAALLLAARGAAAGEPERDGAIAAPGHGLWFSIGALTGPSKLDGALADYEWDTSPAMAWGARALVGHGPLAAGLRVWSAGTTQTIELPTGTTRPRIASTSLELVGEGRVASWWGAQVLAQASVGRLHLGYHPDRVLVDVGSGTPTEVHLAPLNEWIGGAGIGVRTRLTDRFTTGIGLERRFFKMDTAHRRGGEIVTERQSFGDWSARLELAWFHGAS